jgi:hypothetical protein
MLLGKGGLREGGTMKILSTVDFFAETVEGHSIKTNMAPFEGHPFQCACGKNHLFQLDQIQVLRELSNMRLVLECPDNPYFLTCIKAKGIFRFKGFESEFGYKAVRTSTLLAWIREGKNKPAWVREGKNKEKSSRGR